MLGALDECPPSVVQQARKLGPNVGRFAERLHAACRRALGFELVDARRLERILALGVEHAGQPAPPHEQRIQPLPPGHFTDRAPP